jgi:MarR family transcriptional regulator, organic hydroperoxide resistance regulator
MYGESPNAMISESGPAANLNDPHSPSMRDHYSACCTCTTMPTWAAYRLARPYVSFKPFAWPMPHKDGRKSPTLLVHRASKLISREIEIAFADSDLRYSQWVALALIDERHARTMSAVADCMGFYAGAATRLLDHLEHDGLLTRSRDRRDRRTVHVRLTKFGRAAIEKGRRLVERRWNALLFGLSSDEIEGAHSRRVIA